MQVLSQRSAGDCSVSMLDLEIGPGHKARRPLHGRSLAIRVLGVVAAATACLLEGKSTFVPQVQSAAEGALGSDSKSSSLLAGKATQEAIRKIDPGHTRTQRLPQRVATFQDVRPGTLVGERQSSVLGRAVSMLTDSSVWMSASLASLVPFVQITSGVSIDLRPFWAGFCESLVVYTIDHLRDLRKGAAKESISAGRERLLKGMCFLGLIGFVASLAAAPAGRHLAVALTFVVHLMLCVVYAKIKPRMPYLKAAYVSLCVVFMAVAAPAAYDPGLLASFTPAALVRLVLVILSVSFTIENLQDLRDIKEDREAGIVTIPSGLGVEWTAKFLLLSQFVSVAFQCCLSMLDVLPLRADMLLIHAMCGICAISFKENTPPYLFQVVLEPLYVSPLVMLLVRASFLGA